MQQRQVEVFDINQLELCILPPVGYFDNPMSDGFADPTWARVTNDDRDPEHVQFPFGPM